jgi:hypothetical protein
MINVVNKKTHTATSDDVYIGRGSALGNPFTHLPISVIKSTYWGKVKHVETREEAIESFRSYILEKMATKGKEWQEMMRIKELASKGDVNLVCFCRPLGCHGDIIKELIETEQI